ncbi:hypothetical protein HAX54_036848, partial [Datura stramonium]|nr:hypothetical protein [Datura stramonium]
ENHQILENGVISSSSLTLTSPILDPPPPLARHIDRITNNNLLENRDTIDILEIELLCYESFTEFIKEEEEEVVEEDVNATTVVSYVNKLHRVHEEEQGRKEHDDGQNGNQESNNGE